MTGLSPGRIRRSVTVLTAIGAALTVAAFGNGAAATTSPPDWTMFHHDPMHTGVAADTTIGATFAAGLTVKWKTKLRSGITASAAVVHNNVLGRNVVYTADGGAVFGLDAATGQVIWSRSVGPGVHSSPAVVSNTVYIGASDYYLYALDAATGALQCRFFTGGKVVASPVVASVDATGPVVFVGDQGISERSNAGHEWAINGVGNTAGDCTERWVFTGWENRGAHGAQTGSWSSPALATDGTGRPLAVFGSSNPDDAVYALDARDGSLVWHFQTEVTALDEDVGAGPTIGAPGVNGIADGAVYVAGKDAIEYAIDLLTGAELWEFDMRADAGVKTNCVSTAALVGNHLVVAYDTYVYKLDAVTGKRQLRTAAASSTFLSSPAVSGGTGDRVVFSGDLAGVEHGYRLVDGAEVFSLTTGAAVLSSATISSGMVFFGGTDHYFYALG